jgi:hypothetical protein
VNRRFKIVVEVDPALADGMSSGLVARLAQGVTVSTCYRGVRVDGLTRRPRVFGSVAALTDLLAVARAQVDFVKRTDITSTATGRWMLDRAMFYRLVAQELFSHRHELWPE